ncbi:DUF692 family multinuclear iron-containing protein [Pedobacter sp. SYSU D00535]|uniref:multinuclear nonheme iron-dependent oxidase n=1 Tax=Pedobacter sp. SYSU D00535 TaxID=2810308 RepID=UPI001A97BD69|nr:DUF692 family multinuclear iron-containing protein [Pedobacter sp. SYSU D00535]
MKTVYSSVACNLDRDILAATIPLLAESRVEAIEWSFDALYKIAEVPDWFQELLHTYSKENRLIGHGVFFSIFSGRFLPEQKEWLKQLRQTASHLKFDHITEHFGFMTGPNFHHGAPLNIPCNEKTLAIGRDRLARIQEACHCPIGLENLAFAFSLDDVQRQGAFLEKLVEPINGFIILDLHNLFCQLHNFQLDFDQLIQLYPLHRVREIHISGGSWESSEHLTNRQIRRDTHDDLVPEEVFQLLELAIPKCPELKYVVMEQVGAGLKTAESKTGFYADFLKMEAIVKRAVQLEGAAPVNRFLPEDILLEAQPVEDEALYQQQLELSEILETSSSYAETYSRVQHSSLSKSDWNIESWKPWMLETAVALANKWK